MLKRIKASEFYEKYCKISNADGTVSSPRPLLEDEKKFLDDSFEGVLNICYLKIVRKKTGEVIEIDLERLERRMAQLQGFIKVTN